MVTMLVFIICLVGITMWQRGQIHIYQQEVGRLQAEKEKRPLAPKNMRPIEIQPCTEKGESDGITRRKQEASWLLEV